MADQAHVLVVANRTAGSTELLDALRERADQGPASFHLVVPSSPRGASWAFDMHSGHDAAEHDLDGALERIRGLGLEVEGEVGDPDPVAAVSDSANAGSYDEVIVSTLPKHLSKWLKLDVAHKVAHATGLPVTHVECHSKSEAPA
jgi:nucleotide-binding universal stress UspA family protein